MDVVYPDAASYLSALDATPTEPEEGYSEIPDYPFWGKELWYGPSPQPRDASRPDATFQEFVCPSCKGNIFRVLTTGPYETSVRCMKDGCGLWFVVHSG